MVWVVKIGLKTRSSSTRDQLVNVLKVNKPMSVAKMAKELSITEMAIRRHLSNLEKDNLIDTIPLKKSMGRPLKLYTLSQHGEEELSPRNYRELVVELLEDLEDLKGSEIIKQLLEKRMKRLTKRYWDRFQNLTFDEKVIELARIQEENGYMVDLELDDHRNYIMKEYNCPLSRVAKKYDSICTCELTLFKELLGTDAIECRPNLIIDGDFCEYIIKRV